MNSQPHNSISKESAIENAVTFMAVEGYKHGAIIGAKPLPNGTWVIEFAYEGLTERSETSDPPSIVLSAGETSTDVKSVELM